MIFFFLQLSVAIIGLVCSSVQASYAPRCHTEYDTVLTTTYQDKCATTYENVCKPVQDTKCR